MTRMHGTIAALLTAAALSAACAPTPYRLGSYPGPYARINPYPSRYAGAEGALASPVGRWDNVMLLPAGTLVQALSFDGRKPRGEVTSADAQTLRVLTLSGEVALAAADVMRVDRLPQPASRAYGAAAGKGAVLGAGFVGVMGLLVGHAPPARVVAAGAIMGAGSAVENESYARSAVTIYLAERRLPPRLP